MVPRALATNLLIDKRSGVSIEWQEPFPIVIACTIWYHYVAGKRLQFWCNNESAVTIVNSGHSKAPQVMDLVRFLVLTSTEKHNFLVRARHVPGVNNAIADAPPVFRSSVSGNSHLPQSRPPVPFRLLS